MIPTGARPPAVPFDHAAAAVAVAALDRAAAVLADVGTVRSKAGAVAKGEFQGSYARQFARADHDLGQATAEARSAIAELRRAIAAASDAARMAQAARRREQQAWDAARTLRPPGRFA